MKVTLKQIAERTGVSINTVSMVLRGMSGISAPTRERVRRAAEEMGYRRQLKPAATKQSLCLVSAERHRRDSYSYTEFNRIFMSYAAAHEFSVVTAEAEQFRDDPEGAQRRIEEAGVGGILTLGDIDETLFSRLRRCGLPIVSVGARYYREPVCTFTEDEIARMLGEIFHGMVFVLQNGNAAATGIHPAVRGSSASEKIEKEHPNLSEKG